MKAPMTTLADSYALIRQRRDRVRLGRALAQLAVCAVVLGVLLITIDLAYQASAGPRGVALGLALACLLGIAAVLIRHARQTLTDSQAALLIEAKHPRLQGLAIAAAEFAHEVPSSDDSQMLRAALLYEAQHRLASLDLEQTIDRRPLLRSATAAALVLLVAGVLVVSSPAQAAHELLRTLEPWRSLPLTPAEAAAVAAQQAMERERKAQEEAVAASRRAAGAPVVFTVTPGAAEVERGGTLDVSCVLSRVDASPQLRYQLSDGTWRYLPMTPSAEDPNRFTTTIADLADDAAYGITMASSASPTYAITVYDQVQVKDLHATYHAPSYARLPDWTSKGGDLEALVGSLAKLSLTATGPLEQVQLLTDDGLAVPFQLHGAELTASLPLTADGGYLLRANDAHGHHPIGGLASHYVIHAVADLPPTIDLLYPSLDTEVHPLETIAIAANVADDVGLKEIRLCSTYGLEEPRVERRSCVTGPANLTNMLVQFTIDLKAREVHLGDTIIFHLEAEDLKGQKVSSDAFVLKVRGYELMQTYSDGNHPTGGTSHKNPLYVTLLGALHDLDARRSQLTAEQFQAECAHLAELYLPYANN